MAVDAVTFGVAARRWDTHPGDATAAAGMVTVCHALSVDVGIPFGELRERIAQYRRDGVEWLQIWAGITGRDPAGDL